MSEEEEKENKDMFRLHTLEERFNPSQLDLMLEVVRPKNWYLLIAIVGIFLVAVFWSIFGAVSVNIMGKGIVISSGGLYSVQNRVLGIVKTIDVVPGQVVEKGTLIMELTDPEKEIMLESATEKLKKAEQDLERLRKEIAVESAALKDSINKEISAKEYAVSQLKTDIKDSTANFETQKQLAEKGLISQIELIRSQESLVNKRVELETVQASISTMKARLIQGYRTEELKGKEQEVFRAMTEVDVLQSNIDSLKIYNYSNGKVLDLLVNIGDMIGPGTPVVWMEHVKLDTPTIKTVLGFFPIEKGKKIKVGDRVDIELKTVNTSEYGYLVGRVSHVSSYAESQKNIARLIQNDGLAVYLTDQMPVAIQVNVALEEDSSTPSGYKWTSGQGPDIQIQTGTICQLRTTIERIRPIYYVFPIWELKFVTSSLSKNEPKNQDRDGKE